MYAPHIGGLTPELMHRAPRPAAMVNKSKLFTLGNILRTRFSVVIAQMFEWTWDSVAAECTAFLGPAGYGFVQGEL